MKIPNYASLLKKVREDKGMTQKELADNLSYSSQTISLWEMGTSSMKIDTLYEVCNVLKIDPIKFLSGEIEPKKTESSFDINSSLDFIKTKIEDKGISRKELEDRLNVSSPTLRKLLSGLVSFDVNQMSLLSNVLCFEFADALKEKNESEHQRKNKRKLIVISSSIAILLSLIGVGAYFCIKKGLENEEKIEPIPDLKINYVDKTIEGFSINSTYYFNDLERYVTSSILEIEDSWIDNYLTIKKKGRDSSFSNSSPITLYIKSANFENSFPLNVSSYLEPNDVDPLLDERLEEFSKFWKLNEEEKRDLYIKWKPKLIDNLSCPIPYLNSSYFNNYLSSYADKFDEIKYTYEIKSENDGEINKDYIEITGLNDKNSSYVYIPAKIEEIDDVRIASYAFDGDKYKNLKEITFEQKPHYVGQFAFNNLNLDVLDFGIINPVDYEMVMPFDGETTYKNETRRYSNALANIKKIEKARFPVYAKREDTSNVFWNSFFGKTVPVVNDDFLGISAMFISKPSSEPYWGLQYNFFKNMKIRSVYIPKEVSSYSVIWDEEDIYLRLIKFEDGYQCNNKYYEYDYNYANYKFASFLALEYVLFDGVKEDMGYFVSEGMLRGAISFKGSLHYEDMAIIGTQAFEGSRLPSKITLRKANHIYSNAFKSNVGLKQIDIYKSNEITSTNKLKIEEGAFRKCVASSNGLERIVFHGFSKDKSELDLHQNYREDGIEEIFID